MTRDSHQEEVLKTVGFHWHDEDAHYYNKDDEQLWGDEYGWTFQYRDDEGEYHYQYLNDFEDVVNYFK